MNKNKKAVESEAKPFTEFTIGDQVVPVVATLDDLPRAARRKLRNTTFAGVSQMTNPGEISGEMYEMFIQYAVTYAASQGISINLNEDLPEAEATEIDTAAMLAGVQLVGHFRGVDDNPKAEENPEMIEASESN